MSNKDKNEWGSNLSFLLAMIGSAVGLGNIWRYPYVLYANGGGAFYIPYIVAILLMGVPFLILEYGVGYNYKSSFAKALTKINSRSIEILFFNENKCKAHRNDKTRR